MRGLICVRTYLAAIDTGRTDEHGLLLMDDRSPEQAFALAYVDVRLSCAITVPRAVRITTEDGELLWTK